MASFEKLQEMLDEALAAQPDDIDGREMDSRLHEYQKEAVQHLHANPRAGLFLEMGLGKTFVVLAALEPEHLPAIVIAPKRAAESVWVAERDQWRPDLSIALAAGSPAKRAEALSSGADVVVIGRDNIKDIPEKHSFRTFVLDELSSWKSRGTQRWKLTKKLVKRAAYVWGLTGTPSPNGMMDLWAQIYLLDQGERLGTTLTGFRQRYFTPGRRINAHVFEWDLNSGADKEIQKKISDICLSMVSAHYLDLPSVSHNAVKVAMPSKAMKAYREIQKTLTTQIEDETYAVANAAVMTSKLSQLSAGFLYRDEDEGGGLYDFHDEKIKAIEEIIEGTGSPVLIFYRFVEELKRLKQAFPDAVDIKEKGVLDQWNRGEIPVLLAHPASAGHGLNLQKGGHTIIWSSLTWSPEEYQQANARINRQGQEKPVVIHYVMAEGTVDEHILDRLNGKKTKQDALMDALHA